MTRRELEIFLNITRDGAYSNLALKEGLSDERTNAVGRSTALIYTALENLNYCDFIIGSYAKGRVHSSVRGILRLALTEMFFMDTPDHAVCNEAAAVTAQIGKPQLKGFVNGVLRAIARDRAAEKLPPLPEDPVKRLEITGGYPAFMVEEYVRKYGVSFTEAMLLARVKGTSLRAVPPFTADMLAEHLAELGVEFRRSALVPDALVAEGVKALAEDELFRAGRFTVQSESAMLACRCLAPRKGMRVLDSCAAPGGKTAYLFDLMAREGAVTAWDIHPHRVELIKNTLSRLGIKGVECAVKDASQSDPALDNSFDAILCDVPCSGLGGGSKPEARYKRTEESIAGLAELQLRILTACSGYLKPGGALVYSTCTVSERENEHVIERFLAENEGFELASIAKLLPESLRERGMGGMLHLYPNTDGTEGFFIARLERRN